MDMLLFICFVSVIAFKVYSEKESTPEVKPIETTIDDSKRIAKLNDTLYHDENAFSEIINALGFPKR